MIFNPPLPGPSITRQIPILNTFAILLSRVVGHSVDWVILKNEKWHGMGFFLTTIIAQIVFGILVSIVVLWFSRQREFKADAGGAMLLGRENMIAPLEALQKGIQEPLPDQMSAFGISGKPSGRGFSLLFMSHPPWRIALLH